MPKHKVGTREEWSAARKALLEHGVRHLPGSRHAAPQRDWGQWVTLSSQCLTP